MFFIKRFFNSVTRKIFPLVFFQESGFTLIELLTSISIIAIMTAIVFANPHKSRQQLALQKSTYQVSQAIRIVEGMGISASKASVCSNTVPKGGYGIYFSLSSPSQYTIFADCNGNGEYDINSSEMISTSSLKKNTFITSVSPDSPLSVFFIPPDPKVIIKYGSGSTTSEASITLGCKASSITKIVKVADTGLIYVATSTGTG